MTRRLWCVGWVLVGLAWPAVVVLYMVGIWTGIGRLAGMATILLLAALGGTIAMSWWSGDPPEPPPSRRIRKQLRREHERIELERAIRDAEREAGL